MTVELKGCSILVTGPAGQIAFPLVSELAKDNEVWGIARFSEPGSRERVEAAGVRTAVVDLAEPDWSALPSRFDYVLHLAIMQTYSLDYDYALKVNAEGTGVLMSRFRSAKACLVVSTVAVYAIDPDPKHLLAETSPLGDALQPYSPPYSVTKIAQEGVARFMAREHGLATTIARMNVSYSANGGLPAYQLDMILNDQPVPLPDSGPTFFNPIDQSDINAQVPKLLDVASVPATVLNWAGDELVQTEEWLAFLGELVGKTPNIVYTSDAIASRPMDNTKRRALIGACSVGWRDGFRAMARGRYPDLSLHA